MNTSDADRVAQAIGFLDTNYRSQPSLNEVAGAVGLSPFHFQRLFKRWAGVTPKRFLQFLTLDHAKAALAEGRSVLETSWDVGLSGPGRLHDLFLAVEAVTPGEFKQRGAGLTVKYGYAESPFGRVLTGLTDRGLCGLTFTDKRDDQEALSRLKRRWPGATLVHESGAAREIARRVFGNAEGGRLTLDLKGTNFQIKVWEALLRIPSGTLVTYGDVARAIGHPQAHRAVGTAVGANPIAYLIPCHRVIKSTGAFGNYAGGAVRKKSMIGWEAARAVGR